MESKDRRHMKFGELLVDGQGNKLRWNGYMFITQSQWDSRVNDLWLDYVEQRERYAEVSAEYEKWAEFESS